ncbi:MAG: hypothetical protein ACTHQM_25590 [Thermoanaerobaculia bacterium]
MNELLDKNAFEFVCLAKLVFDGGSGYLSPVPIARALGSSSGFVTHAIARLLGTKRIEAIDKSKHHYRIARWTDCRFAPGEADAAGPVKVHFVTAADITPPKPSEIALRLLTGYHRHVRKGGPYIEAAERIQRVIDNGQSESDVQAAILSYKKATADHPERRRNAFNFFETYTSGHYWGGQWTPQAPPTSHPPSDDVSDLKDRMQSSQRQVMA